MESLRDKELCGHQDSGRPSETGGRWGVRVWGQEEEEGPGEKGRVWAVTRPEWHSVQHAG